jgi:hypothetical protein
VIYGHFNHFSIVPYVQILSSPVHREDGITMKLQLAPVVISQEMPGANHEPGAVELQGRCSAWLVGHALLPPRQLSAVNGIGGSRRGVPMFGDQLSRQKGDSALLVRRAA